MLEDTHGLHIPIKAENDQCFQQTFKQIVTTLVTAGTS